MNDELSIQELKRIWIQNRCVGDPVKIDNTLSASDNYGNIFVVHDRNDMIICTRNNEVVWTGNNEDFLVVMEDESEEKGINDLVQKWGVDKRDLNLGEIQKQIIVPVNALIEEAKLNQGDFDSTGINWLDLSCPYAEVCINTHGLVSIVAIVTEAQPSSCIKLCRYIIEQMKQRHGIDISVQTCW